MSTKKKEVIKLTEALNRNIGARIKEIRTIKHLSRREIAEFLDITHQQITKYETGDNRISACSLVLVAKKLGVDITTFFEGDAIDVYIAKDEELDRDEKEYITKIIKTLLRIESSKKRNAVKKIVDLIQDL